MPQGDAFEGTAGFGEEHFFPAPALVEEAAGVGEVELDGLYGSLAHGDDAFLVALAEDADGADAEVGVLELEFADFAGAES